MSDTFKNYFLTTFFIVGLSLLWGPLRMWAISSKWILREQMNGLIPFMSVMVQPTVHFCSFNKLINFSSCLTLSSEEIMIGKVSLDPNNACLRPLGNGDNLTFGVLKIKGFYFFLSHDNS